MESSSLKKQTAEFGFTDLHSFKDYVVFVLSCAPDLFPEEDWLPAAKQMNIERAFSGLYLGLDLLVEEHIDGTTLGKCRELIQGAYSEYKIGHDLSGQRMLEEVEKLLASILSR